MYLHQIQRKHRRGRKKAIQGILKDATDQKGGSRYEQKHGRKE